MRHLLLSAALLALAGTAQAQSWETTARLNTAGFNFRGSSATRESVIWISDVATIRNYTNNPYGARPGFSYGASLQAQRVTKANVLLGMEAGYERLRSRVAVTAVGDLPTTAQGDTYLNHDFVNLHPYVGARLGHGPLHADLSAGVDLGILLHCQEKGRASNGSVTYTTDLERPQPRLDVRPRLDLTTYYQRYGLSLGYAHGLTNYRRDWVGGVNEAYSQVWRLGVVYRLTGG